jgi:hypothetical protein
MANAAARRTEKVIVAAQDMGDDIEVLLSRELSGFVIRHERASDVEQVINRVPTVDPPSLRRWPGKGDHTSPLTGKAMTRGAVEIV